MGTFPPVNPLSKMPKVLVAAEKMLGNYKESTIKRFVKELKTLDKKIDIDDGDTVLKFLKTANLEINSKTKDWFFWKVYAKYNGLKIPEAKFGKNLKIPYVPSEEMIDAVINGARNGLTRNSLILMKHTGCRVGELKQMYVDKSRGCVVIQSEKKRGTEKQRMVSIPYHVAEIQEWRKNGSHVSEAVRGIVKRLAKLTGNNDYLKIHGHTFRHYFGTEVYARTHDLMLVKELLGHEDVRETQIYVTIVRMSRPKIDAIKIGVDEPEKMVEKVKEGWRPVVTTENYVIFEKPTFP